MVRSHSDIHLGNEGSVTVRVTNHDKFVAVAITAINAQGYPVGTTTFYADSATQLGDLAKLALQSA